MEQKYYKVNEIAQMFSIKPKTLREYCHARGQRFASQPVKGGNIIINLAKFEEWLKNRPADWRRAR